MKFIRQDAGRYSKLGKKRKKLLKWRKPKGRHSKMREKRIGYPASPKVGHKSNKKEAGKINGKMPYLVYNSSDLEKAGKDSMIIIGKVGARKRLELIKKADEKNLEILNVVRGENAAK